MSTLLVNQVISQNCKGYTSRQMSILLVNQYGFNTDNVEY